MINKIIIITGAPGIGKTTILEKLRSHFSKGFFVDVDEFRKSCGNVRLNYHDQDYDEILKVLEIFILSLSQNDYFKPVFVFDCMSPKRLFSFYESVSKAIEVIIFVLWEDNTLLEERMKSRHGHFYNDIENAKKLNNSFLELKDNKKVVFIDRTVLDVENTVREILTRL